MRRTKASGEKEKEKSSRRSYCRSAFFVFSTTFYFLRQVSQSARAGLFKAHLSKYQGRMPPAGAYSGGLRVKPFLEQITKHAGAEPAGNFSWNLQGMFSQAVF